MKKSLIGVLCPAVAAASVSCTTVLLLLLTVSCKRETGNDYKYTSSWESLGHYRCPDWFRDAKLGIWSCFNAYTVPANGDWYARGMYEQGSRRQVYLRNSCA